MKTVLSTNPTFNPAAKTLDFSSVAGFELKRLLAVINASRDAVIFAVGTPQGFSSFSSNVLTLDFDTTAHNASDVLICFYDSATNEVTAPEIKIILEQIQAMTEILESLTTALLRSQPQLDTTNRPLVRVNAIDTNLTLTTLTNLNNLVGGNTAGLPYQLAPATYLYDKIVTS